MTVDVFGNCVLSFMNIAERHAVFQLVNHHPEFMPAQENNNKLQQTTKWGHGTDQTGTVCCGPTPQKQALHTADEGMVQVPTSMETPSTSPSFDVLLPALLLSPPLLPLLLRLAWASDTSAWLATASSATEA